MVLLERNISSPSSKDMKKYFTEVDNKAHGIPTKLKKVRQIVNMTNMYFFDHGNRRAGSVSLNS